MSYLFLWKLNGTDDRDCCSYVEDKAHRDICGNIILHGACYCGGKDWFDKHSYDEFTTILTEDEFNLILKSNKELSCQDDTTEIIKRIFDKLKSKENEKLFNQVQEEEWDYLYDEYGLDRDDIKDIVNEYTLDYRDRSIVGTVYNDSSDLGYNEAISLGYMSWKGDDPRDKYFDYEKFGEDLLEDYWYLELKDGRVVSLNY